MFPILLLTLASLSVPLFLVATVGRRAETWPEWRRRWRSRHGHGSFGFVAAPLLAAISLGAILAAAHIWIPLAIVILSSLVTGLTTYPQASGVVGIIRRVISLLSLVQHYDSPGSLKIPLVLPAAPAVLGSAVKPVAPKGFAASEALWIVAAPLLIPLGISLLAVVLIADAARKIWRTREDGPTWPGQRGFVWLVVLVVIGAVALLGGAGAIVLSGHADGGIGAQIVDCTERAISAEATSAAPQVAAILSGSAVDWQQQLVALEAAVGEGVLCDVAAIAHQLAAHPAAELAPHDQIILVRARAFLASQPLKVR